MFRLTLHRRFYSGISEKKTRRLRSATKQPNYPKGRTITSDDFERKIILKPLSDFKEYLHVDYEFYGPHKKREVVWVDFVTLADARGHRLLPPNPLREKLRIGELKPMSARNLRRNADSWYEKYPIPDAPPLPSGEQRLAHVIHVVDPDLNEKHYLRVESEVEMLTAYRNVLEDCIDIPGWEILRMQPFCHGAQSIRFPEEEIVKLNRTAILKGFHRLPLDRMEKYQRNEDCRLELYVPPALLGQYKVEMLEHWIPPRSLTEHRPVYQQLGAPQSLLENDAWAGQRPELLYGNGQPRQLDDGKSTETVGDAEDTSRGVKEAVGGLSNLMPTYDSEASGTYNRFNLSHVPSGQDAQPAGQSNQPVGN